MFVILQQIRGLWEFYKFYLLIQRLDPINGYVKIAEMKFLANGKWDGDNRKGWEHCFFFFPLPFYLLAFSIG